MGDSRTGRRRAHIREEGTEINNGVFFYFYIFQKYFLQKYIFDFTIYSFIPAPRACRPAGGDRDLHVNKNNFYLRGGPWREPAALLSGGRPSAAPPPAQQGVAGSPSPQNCSSGPLDVVLDILDTNKNH